MHPTVARMQPSVANTSHSCNFPQRCRGAHCAPADILPTPDSLPPRPPSSREGDRRSGGRSSRIEHPPTFCFLLKPLIQLRVQGRNPARFNGGYGVPRGFKGGSKPSAPCGRLSEAEHPKRKGATLLRPLSAVNSKSPPNPLGLAERVPRPQAVEGVFQRWKEFLQAVKGVGARIARPFIPHPPIFSHFRHNSAILC